MLNRLIRFFLENRLVSMLLLLALMGWGLSVAPFDWHLSWMPRDPVPVDAIPDIGENQQIVYAEWSGRSPQDVEDQVTYPLTTALLGVPGVKTIRSNSMFGFSSIYVIFNEDVEFYWSRSRVLEKLNSLPAGTLPSAVQPALGPDATALGQVFWYTLEGRNPETGEPTGGWDPQELRTVQDFQVKYALASATGVSEVASVGGYVKEYQVDIDPQAMRAAGVSILQIMEAVRQSNLDIGAETIEMNRAEYLVRGLGYVKDLEDLEASVVAVRDNVPIRIKDVARVTFGPATRRGGLDKGGAMAVGAAVVARYGANPKAVIENIKTRIAEIAPGLPSKTLADGTVSKITIVPFYDRAGLIQETIGTLETALSHEILISIIVVIVLVANLRASLLISSLLPVAVLMTFIVMQYAGVDANVVALSGIAIAIGVMVDVGIVFVENIVRHLELPENEGARGRVLLEIIYTAAAEVSGAVTTALATTIVSFLPVFAMEAAEGKLFRPLAFTKTFALLAAFVLGIALIPTLSYFIFSLRFDRPRIHRVWNGTLIAAGLILAFYWGAWLALLLVVIGINNLLVHHWPAHRKTWPNWINIALVLLLTTFFLAEEWLPLGPGNSLLANFLFVAGLITLILGTLLLVVHFYLPVLNWCLAHKWLFMTLPLFTILLGMTVWLGWNGVFGWAGSAMNLRQTSVWRVMLHTFPGVGKEFMPALDEGSFLLMPSTMPHTGVEENVETIRQLDLLVNQVPEVDMTVGKWGRINSALDAAPISMFENVVNYRPEYLLDQEGHRKRFQVDQDGRFLLRGGSTYDPAQEFRLVPADSLIPDPQGDFFRQWRPHIHSADDIWEEIIAVAQLPGMTSAPKLQPIQTRLIMLQTGMRAPMGIKVYGPDLATIEQVGLQLEKILQEVPLVAPASVFADRVVGKPYLEIAIDRQAIARFGLTIEAVQNTLNVAVGGMPLTTTVEGRERFAVRVRYARELRDSPQALQEILVATPTGTQVPLGELAQVAYRRGPQMIKSEDTFLVGYVIFDKKEGAAEVDVVEQAQRFIEQKIETGELKLPAGVSYRFTGNYENQIRATKRLSIVIPISLLLVFLLLYFQFHTVTASAIHFSGVFVAFAGGFIMIWLYGQPWFLDINVAGINLRDLFQMHPINLSVAVWVGFIALFGIATDDGVIMGTYIHQVFEERQPSTVAEVREAVRIAGQKRVRPAMMTAATAIIALLPVLSSTGKGSDIMVPMAIPTFGGMIIQVMTMFVVPVLQSLWRESAVKRAARRQVPVSSH
ncbi:Cu(I)/Ag(I) efflux system membrane protein CusA/SilA [Catalinimonas alkaloidigena]|uniref:Cu(I)/Ag(I) efflux system membrane protein CusA/SilA n=1 Tax=Catalinimonas alkaloidigena TaxID=1075417 RepID=A0A1G9VMA3_9BACT|nr:efflux RND transporter permease subunit [Catalinimonas alkaloidigena]SDM73324.1 Cu(I)/Ag(I) efflux system membrane protein CusA/SilA [Catalinimonas alkaloidigena]